MPGIQRIPRTFAADVQTSDVAVANIASVPTTGNAEQLVIAPVTGRLREAFFAALTALAANDTNYVTFTIVNRGQAGAGVTAMLAATDANTTKATGGTALAARGKRSLALHDTPANLVVAKGDVLSVIVTVAGTLGGALTTNAVVLVFDRTD